MEKMPRCTGEMEGTRRTSEGQWPWSLAAASMAALLWSGQRARERQRERVREWRSLGVRFWRRREQGDAWKWRWKRLAMHGGHAA